ncbi:hypothetical protein M011DRAFT_395462 [Sporormia fimetaria CBS 119925]|uniref:Dynamin family protein n=1 Tax=Sporormia fimetaria CBS 119925 TaxID=1340428 RepID=A0A6A6VIZ1_9PLEO|nr:hypothetical protein M011DRAFT_395462 [Sporormia fimetaria CBS 119925]
MASSAPTGGTLEQLQSAKHIALLDAIDQLREQPGVRHYDINVPQLIVCGDQSSGKSSVLEGITGLRFPTKEGTCTTFATEVQLRREVEVSIMCTIIPGASRSDAQRLELRKWSKAYKDPTTFDFGKLIEEARSRMTFGTVLNATTFFEDILSIRYRGPKVPTLTIVDLPGLIQSDPTGRNSRIVDQVHGLVDKYMQDQNVIVLAVVSARNDLENQSVFKKIEQFDPEYKRSLGIITKPDVLDAGSESEAKILKLARNQYRTLDLGWHVLRNRGYGEEKLSGRERDAKERNFFATGTWKTLPKSSVGIDTLIPKLSDLLLNHICKELPKVTKAMRDAITSTETEIASLGKPRDTDGEQRYYLMQSAERFQKLTDNALVGVYRDKFFDAFSVEGKRSVRLRTRVQNLNIEFASVMHRKGHTWTILDEEEDEESEDELDCQIMFPDADAECEDLFQEPLEISREAFLEANIKEYVQNSRPAGLTSVVNSWVISEVFSEQSRPWDKIAKLHLARVFGAVKGYINAALSSILDAKTCDMLLLQEVVPQLDKRWEMVQAKLEELLTPFRQLDPLDYDPMFLYKLHKRRAQRYEPQLADEPAPGRSMTNGQPQLLAEGGHNYTNADILDWVQTYYQVAILTFINNVASLAVENCLVSKLSDIFSPSLVLNMSVEMVATIASESEDTRTQRTEAKKRLAVLKDSKRVLDIQVCNTRTGTKRLISRPRAER